MRAAITLAFLLLATVGRADDAYRPPSGFNGHPWGQPLIEFQNLTLWRAAAAGDARGKMAVFEFQCPQKPCSPDTALINQVPEGRGSYALGEYFMSPDANPWQDQKIALSAITYLFCTSATSWDVPDSVRNSFKLCGSHAFFRSESNYDRVFAQLVAEHGFPDGYVPKGHITIQSDEQVITDERNRRATLSLYRWCGVKESDHSLVPKCPATVTLLFDHTAHMGSVIYATAGVYEFASARYEMGDNHNELYADLLTRDPSQVPRKAELKCTGTRICNESRTPLTAQQMRQFEPPSH